jgi:c-di-GMP-binding flagellar brake protein YcgR
MASLSLANLRFGDVAQLEPALGGRVRHRVQLLGALSGVSLMVTAPENRGQTTLMEGESCIVRIFTGDEALAFRAGVTRVCRQPFPYLHLTWPTEVEKALVRNARRARLQLPARVRGTGETTAGEPVPVVVEDLSTEGAQIESSAELGALGSKIDLLATLNLDRIGERDLSLPAELMNMKQHDDEEGRTVYRYGLRFVDLPTEADLALTAYFYKQLTQQLLNEPKAS